MVDFKGFSPQWTKRIGLGLVFPLLVLNGWILVLVLDYFQSPIRIFIIANLIAFILGYPVRWLQRHPRIQLAQAVFIVCAGAMLILGAIAVIIIPLLAEQINQLLRTLPDWSASGSYHLKMLHQWSVEWRLPTDLSQFVKQFSNQLPQQFQGILTELFGFMTRTAGGLFEAGLIVIIAVYLMLRGDTFWAGILGWFPTHLRQPVRQSLRQSFQNYYIGQSTVALLLGISLIISFTIAQIPFGLLFGLVIGLMAFFPFGGAFSIVVLSFIAALNSFWLGVKVLVIATLVDQVVENAIAPRLLGKFTG
ncbi:MAG: AI-2E family transporter, partial [Microcystaceae cyanobacterium]